MGTTRKSICVVLYGLREYNSRLQPWRYILEVACQLHQLGHTVTVIIDKEASLDKEQMKNIRVERVHSVRTFHWKRNKELYDILCATQPDIVLWSIGLTSFIHQKFMQLPQGKQVGIFSSPLYSWKDFRKIGIQKIMKGIRFSGIHVLGACFPMWFLQQQGKRANLTYLVTQTETTRIAIANRLWNGPIHVIPPGVDDEWIPANRPIPVERSVLGFDKDDEVVAYFGPPSALRGLPDLVRAIAHAHLHRPRIKLLILNRRRKHEYVRETDELKRLIIQLNIQHLVHLVDENLDRRLLVSFCQAADIIALPFNMLSSDAPLSILEACALNKPIVTTRVWCLPELTQGAHVFFSDVGHIPSLAQNLIQALDFKNKGNTSTGFTFARSWQQVGLEWSSFIEAL